MLQLVVFRAPTRSRRNFRRRQAEAYRTFIEHFLDFQPREGV